VSLAGAGVLHVVWGRGATFPYRTRERLNDSLVGRDATPSPAACYAVAGALVAAAAIVGRAVNGGGRVVHVGSGLVAAVLSVRAAFGLAGRTDVLVPGSESDRFRELDRRVLSPLCLSLGAGAACAALSRTW
jgi:Protein of unknown function (DUF3995)